MKQVYSISGMHCASCVAKITAALQPLVQQVSVTLNPPQAVIESSAPPSLASLKEAVSKAGNYHLEPATETLLPKPEKGWVFTYYPLLLIIGLISVASFKDSFGLQEWMLHFMAGFFIVFGFFKLLDIKGFRDAYAGYDLLAQRWSTYGYIYPFLELALGFALLFHFKVQLALITTAVLMAFSSLGVIQALSKKQKIRCACLGTVLNLPMSTITLIEDLGMAVMALIMIF
jgi:copper chaperone CopZ